MTDFEYVLKNLDGMNLKKISREVEVHYATIYNIATKRVTNPKMMTINKLAKYFRSRAIDA